MVHPASGYMIGSLLRRAPPCRKISNLFKEPHLTSLELATKGWAVLWPNELTQRQTLPIWSEKINEF